MVQERFGECRLRYGIKLFFKFDYQFNVIAVLYQLQANFFWNLEEIMPLWVSIEFSAYIYYYDVFQHWSVLCGKQ